MTTSEVEQLEAEFDSQMLWICEECRRFFAYRPTRFQAMVAEMGGLRTAKVLLDPKRPTSQSVAWEELQKSQGRYFYLTMEYLVVQNKYGSLFTPQELKEAEDRLAWFPNERIDRGLYPYPAPPTL